MSPQAALVDRISEAQKLIRRFQEQQEKLKVPPPPLPQPARTEMLGRLGLFRRRPFVFPAGRELREAPPPPDLRELLTERQPLAPISERETPSLAELLGQRQPISPVSARVTAPFQMPRAIPIGRLPGATGEPYRPAQERAIREKLGVAELPPAKVPTREEIVKQYESYFAKLSPEVDLRGNPIPQWKRELSGIGMVGALGAVGAQGVVAGWRALTNLALVRQVSRRLTFGGEPPTQAQTQVIANDIRSMAQKAGRGWELDRKSLRTFFKPIGKGNIAPTEAGVREAEAVAQRAVTRYAPSLVPRGTQTGAMAFGGREARITKAVWDAMPVEQRVQQATQAGLSGQVGSKAFEALTPAERTALAKAVPEAVKLPPGLKKPIESLSSAELERRSKLVTPYKKLYQAELDRRVTPAPGVTRRITRTTKQQDIQETAKILSSKLKESGIPESDIPDLLGVYNISETATETRASLTFEQLRNLTDEAITEDNVRKLTREILAKEFGVPTHEVDLVLEGGSRVNPRLDIQQAEIKAREIDNLIKRSLPTRKDILASINKVIPQAKVTPAPGVTKTDAQHLVDSLKKLEQGETLSETELLKIRRIDPKVERDIRQAGREIADRENVLTALEDVMTKTEYDTYRDFLYRGSEEGSLVAQRMAENSLTKAGWLFDEEAGQWLTPKDTRIKNNRLIAAPKSYEVTIDALRSDAEDMLAQVSIPKAEAGMPAPVTPEVIKKWTPEKEKLFQKDLGEMYDARKEITDELKANGYQPKLNADGTMTIYHGTSEDTADAIKRSGRFNEMSFFSHAKSRAAFGSEGARQYGKSIIEVKVDARDVFFNSGTGEIEAKKGLMRGIDGVWRAPDRVLPWVSPEPAIPKAEVTPEALVTPQEQLAGGEAGLRPPLTTPPPEPTTAVTAKPRAGKVPPAKAPPPAEPPVIEPPEPVPPSDRPRTLLDLNREAKGMRAFSPKDRAAIMDVARPLKEDELLYKVKPFSEHADNLLQPDTPVRAALRAVPGVKQVAGAWTPAQMQRNNPVAMLGVRKAIFEEIEIGRARLATLNWWHDADELFNFKKIKGKWKVTNIELSASAEPSKPYHGTIHDLIEHPGNYVFTPEQEKVLQIAQDMQRQILRDAQRVGVDAVELTGDYWRRIVTKAPKDKMFGGKIQSRIASRKGYTRQRAFDFVDDGAKLGFEYETHPLTALQNRLEAGIRTISDQNTRQAMARLPGVVKPLERLESLYPQTVEGAKTARQARDAAKQVFLRDKTVENETALRQAEADYISSMRELFFKKIEAGQPNIGELKLPNGRIAPAELVEEVRHWIDLPEIVTGRGTITNPTLAVTQLLRSTLTNVDLAAGFIQGQALFYRNNIAWWRSQGNAIVGLIDDPTAYVAKNFDLMDEGMRMGAISIPTEFMFTRQGLASIPTRVPVVGPVMKSFNRAFEWFILTGQTELYRATRSGAIKRIAGEVTEQKSIEALVSLGSAIRKELGTESYAILGVRPTQRTLEQLALFAARFFRSLTGVQAQAFTGGEGGREARRAMGAAIVGGIALTIAASYLLSKKMPNMTDPFNPDWMQFEIGDTRFNAFGPFYPYFRTQARVSIYMLKGKPVEAANEIKRFFQGKAGIPFRAIDMAAQFGVKGSYRTFEGKTLPFTPVGIGEAVLGELAVPISVQEAMRALPQGRPEAVAGEVFGLVGREKYPWFPKETFDAYYEIPADPDEAKAQKKRTRTEYRKTHSTIEAKLFITGRIDTISSEAAISEVLKLVRENKINPDSIRSIQANKEKWTEIRAGKRAPPKSLSLTDKLVARLSQLGVSPVKETPTPVAPATKPKIVIPEGYVPSWAR